MALVKRPSKLHDSVLVTFTVSADAAAKSACLAADFADWVPVEMERSEDGSHYAVVELPRGRAYRFRYLLDGVRWENDRAADDYIANDFGGDDSVVDLTEIELSAVELSAAS